MKIFFKINTLLLYDWSKYQMSNDPLQLSICAKNIELSLHYLKLAI